MYRGTAVITREMLLRDSSLRISNMKPTVFCEKWIPILYGLYPDERGYKAACIRELKAVTKLSETTIKSWGANIDGHPISVERTLYWANMAYTVRHALGYRPNQDF